jgi:hypothetical protein
LSCVAQSLVQQAPASGAETERSAFAQGAITIGQRVRTIARDALKSRRKLVEQLLAQGHSGAHLLEGLMPASYVATNPLNLPSRVYKYYIAYHLIMEARAERAQAAKQLKG